MRILIVLLLTLCTGYLYLNAKINVKKWQKKKWVKKKIKAQGWSMKLWKKMPKKHRRQYIKQWRKERKAARKTKRRFRIAATTTRIPIDIKKFIGKRSNMYEVHKELTKNAPEGNFIVNDPRDGKWKGAHKIFPGTCSREWYKSKGKTVEVIVGQNKALVDSLIKINPDLKINPHQRRQIKKEHRAKAEEVWLFFQLQLPLVTPEMAESIKSVDASTVPKVQIPAEHMIIPHPSNQKVMNNDRTIKAYIVDLQASAAGTIIKTTPFDFYLNDPNPGYITETAGGEIYPALNTMNKFK